MTRIEDCFKACIEADIELRAAQAKKKETYEKFVQKCFDEGYTDLLQINWSRARRYFRSELQDVHMKR